MENSGSRWSRRVCLPAALLVLSLLCLSTQDAHADDALPEALAVSGSTGPTGVTQIDGHTLSYSVVGGTAIAEGDILLGAPESLPSTTTLSDAYIVGSVYRWPGGIVPVAIDPSLPNPSRVLDAMAHWNDRLAGSITLRLRTTETAYVNVVPGSGCSSFVGYQGWRQELYLADSCLTGNVIHELGHAIGLWHEQSRNDRDTYVRILTANISPSSLYNFDKSGSQGASIGAYDFGSIMHYGAYSFSMNGLPTIETIPPGIAIGQRDGLSAGDIAAVRALYGQSTVVTPPPPSATAVFVKQDTTTQGTWKPVYGADGQSIPEDVTALPAYAILSLSGQGSYVWTNSTTDPRATQKVASSDRLASCWYANGSFTIDLNLTDSVTHPVALYATDWDRFGGGRMERVEVMDAGTGTVLDTRTLSSFTNGIYLVWNLQGHVKIRVTNLNAASNALVSALFLGGGGGTSSGTPSATVSFVATDLSTKGSWKTVYGADGESIAADGTALPAYATLSLSGQDTYVWTNSTTDTRATQKVASTDRLASCWYSGSSFTMDVNLTDTSSHSVALYAVDWDGYGGGRSERVEVLDATTGAVLDTRTLSSFSNGAYLVWSMKGHVKIKVTNLNGSSNALVSGLFFGGAGTAGNTTSAAASFVTTDLSTLGSWKGVYGAEGQSIPADVTALPSYAALTLSGQDVYVWTNSTADPRATQKAASADRLASCWYANGTFTMDLNLADSTGHRVALYAMDWDGYGGGRSERIEVLDAATGAVLDTRTLSNFSNGAYLVWTLQGHVKIRVTNLNGASNAVVTGLFFGGVSAVSGASTSAVFVKEDTATQGAWSTSYGVEGTSFAGDALSMPAYAAVSVSGHETYVWANSTSDPRALRKPNSTDGLASCWFSATSFTIDVNLTDANSHQVALYALDWDVYGGGRLQRVDVLDAATGAVLDTRNLGNFSRGTYLVWSLRGHVRIRVTNTNPAGNAVVSGLFIGSAAAGDAVSATSGAAVRVHPNPFRAPRGDSAVVFDGVDPGATVKIFSLSGQLVKTIRGDRWDTTNDKGQKVASGIYLFWVDRPGPKSRGKLAIIR